MNVLLYNFVILSTLMLTFEGYFTRDTLVNGTFTKSENILSSNCYSPKKTNTLVWGGL